MWTLTSNRSQYFHGLWTLNLMLSLNIIMFVFSVGCIWYLQGFYSQMLIYINRIIHNCCKLFFTIYHCVGVWHSHTVLDETKYLASVIQIYANCYRLLKLAVSRPLYVTTWVAFSVCVRVFAEVSDNASLLFLSDTHQKMEAYCVLSYITLTYTIAYLFFLVLFF